MFNRLNIMLRESFGDGKSVVFASLKSFDDSLRYLQRLPHTPNIYGEVQDVEVKLKMVNLGRHNGTVFIGQLVKDADQVQLVGNFRSSRFNQFFGAIFLFLCTVFFCVGLVTSILQVTSIGFKFPEFAVAFANSVLIWSLLLLFAYGIIWQVSPTKKDMEVVTAAIRKGLNNT